MCEIHPLDKDTIEISCGDTTTIIQTEDTLVFTEEYLDYSVGDTITVEPIKDEDEIQLLCRSNSRHIREHGIIEMVCDGIITVQ